MRLETLGQSIADIGGSAIERPHPYHYARASPRTDRCRHTVSAPRLMSLSRTLRIYRRDCLWMSSRAKRSRSSANFSSCSGLNTSRASLRTKLRVTDPPALRPSATMSRPSGFSLGPTYAIQEPIDTRWPERRMVFAGEFGRVLTLHVSIRRSGDDVLLPCVASEPFGHPRCSCVSETHERFFFCSGWAGMSASFNTPCELAKRVSYVASQILSRL